MAGPATQPEASTSKIHAPLSAKLQGKLRADDVTPAPEGPLLGLDPTTSALKLASKHIALDNLPRESDSRRKAKLIKASEAAKLKRARVRGHRSRGILSKSERRPSDGNELTWDAVLALHRLWLGYMAELLGLAVKGAQTIAEVAEAPGPSRRGVAAQVEGEREPAAQHGFSPTQLLNLQSKLTKADFLGCRMSVKRAKNASLVGVEGIVVQETGGTWTVVTVDRGAKVLPKPGTIFTFQVPLAGPDDRALSFDLAGDQFAHRPAERATRKIKARGRGDFAPWDQ